VTLRLRGIALIAPLLFACGRAPRSAKREDAIVVFNAGSLARPLRAALDTFALRENVRVEQESAGSLETARKLTDLHRTPDLIGLADYKVFAELLMPRYVTWYAQFARNRMVLAYTERSHHAAEIDSMNWWRIISAPGVQVGRADPNLDPNGYRTVIVLELAERYYHHPGLTDSALRNSAAHVVRPKEVDLMGLLQAGELDYIWSYESVAQATGLRYVRLPDAIDLGNPADSTAYAQAAVRVTGKTPRDSITFRGEPILYGVSIPRDPPHPQLAERFAAFLLSADGRRILRREYLDALEPPRLVGDGAPPRVRDAAGATAGAR
jgi:molybdate/tungstate transport system substrate-binding protein